MILLLLCVDANDFDASILRAIPFDLHSTVLDGLDDLRSITSPSQVDISSLPKMLRILGMIEDRLVLIALGNRRPSTSLTAGMIHLAPIALLAESIEDLDETIVTSHYSTFR